MNGRVQVAGITVHPKDRWMQQMARNVTMEGWGFLQICRYLLHDRDTKYVESSISISRTFMQSAIIKVRAISCCFRGLSRFLAISPCGVANASVESYATITRPA